MWTGMAPVYAKAVILALAGGPNRKPVYTVTRKEDDFRWHWRQTLPQATLVLAVVCVMVYALRFHTLPSLGLLAGSVYWGGLNIVLLMSFIARGWYGIRRGRLATLRRLRSAVAKPVAASGSEHL